MLGVRKGEQITCFLVHSLLDPKESHPDLPETTVHHPEILDFVPNVGIRLDSGFSLGEEVNLFHAWDRWEELWQRMLDFSNAFSLLSCIQLYYISQPPLQLNVVL